MASIGIRHETKSEWERRVAVTPELAAQLVAQGVDVRVQRSDRRCFADADYEAAGAELTDDLPTADVLIAVKEVPAEFLKQGGAYLFFAHVIKGQPYNMPMLQRLLDLGCTLLDYEKITDEEGRRLVFFGKHAGMAGMIDALWALGHKLAADGVPNPFTDIRMAHDYATLGQALSAVRAVGNRIRAEGVPADVHPLTIGVAGYGNVASGVQRVLGELPVVAIDPLELGQVDADATDRVVYSATFKEQHLAAPKDEETTFVLQDYYDHPADFEGTFEGYLPDLTVLMNCIYWTEDYPRLVTPDTLGLMTRCKVIGDISCDVRGSIGVTVKATDPGDPVYTYDRDSDSAVMGFDGRGPVICAVDILPAELPREASETFSEALAPYAAAIATCDYDVPFEALDLPAPIKRAVIAHRGSLTPDYAYIAEFL